MPTSPSRLSPPRRAGDPMARRSRIPRPGRLSWVIPRRCPVADPLPANLANLTLPDDPATAGAASATGPGSTLVQSGDPPAAPGPLDVPGHEVIGELARGGGGVVY